MNNKRHFTKPMMQSQMRINARLITFYHEQAAQEKSEARHNFKVFDESNDEAALAHAHSCIRLVKVYKGYIRKLAEIQRALKGALKGRSGLSKAEAEGRWPIINKDVAVH